MNDLRETLLFRLAVCSSVINLFSYWGQEESPLEAKQNKKGYLHSNKSALLEKCASDLSEKSDKEIPQV